MNFCSHPDSSQTSSLPPLPAPLLAPPLHTHSHRQLCAPTYLACSWRGGQGTACCAPAATGAPGARAAAVAVPVLSGPRLLLPSRSPSHSTFLGCISSLSFARSRSRPSIRPTARLSSGAPSLSGTAGSHLSACTSASHPYFSFLLPVAQPHSPAASSSPPPSYLALTTSRVSSPRLLNHQLPDSQLPDPQQNAEPSPRP